jgi:hypothetical protein
MNVLDFNGKKVKFYSISELAKKAKKTKHAIYKLEFFGILPKPNYRTQYKWVLKVKNGEDFYKEAKEVFSKYTSGGTLSAKESDVFGKAIFYKQILIGDRLYSEFIFDDLALLLRKIKQGKQSSPLLKDEFINLFQKEKEKCQN